MATDDGTPTGMQYDDPMDRFSSPDEIVKRMRNDTIKKQQDYNDLIREAATRKTSLSPTQGFALTALAALPLIIGRQLSGRTRGATALDAGALGQAGIGGYTQRIEQDDELRRAGLEQQARTAAGDLNIARSQEAALPGMFLRNKLEQDQMGQRQKNELALIREKAAQERQAAVPSEDTVRALEEIRDRGMPDAARFAGLTEKQQGTANRYATIASGVERRSNVQADREARNRIYGVVSLDPSKPLSLTEDQGKIVAKATEGFNSLMNATTKFRRAIQNDDVEGQIAASDALAATLGREQFANTGASTTAVEVADKLGSVPALAAKGQLTRSFWQTGAGLDILKLLDANERTWAGDIEGRIRPYGGRFAAYEEDRPLTAQGAPQGQPGPNKGSLVEAANALAAERGKANGQ